MLVSSKRTARSLIDDEQPVALSQEENDEVCALTVMLNGSQILP